MLQLNKWRLRAPLYRYSVSRLTVIKEDLWTRTIAYSPAGALANLVSRKWKPSPALSRSAARLHLALWTANNNSSVAINPLASADHKSKTCKGRREAPLALNATENLRRQRNEAHSFS